MICETECTPIYKANDHFYVRNTKDRIVRHKLEVCCRNEWGTHYVSKDGKDFYYKKGNLYRNWEFKEDLQKQ